MKVGVCGHHSLLFYGKKQLGFFFFIFLCCTQERKSYTFSKTWGQIIDDRTFILWWTMLIRLCAWLSEIVTRQITCFCSITNTFCEQCPKNALWRVIQSTDNQLNSIKALQCDAVSLNKQTINKQQEARSKCVATFSFTDTNRF